MPPKKAAETTDIQVDPGKPDETAMLFAFEVLRNINNNGQLDIAALSKTMGHTNVASTRNAFARYKKRWGFGNIITKSAAGTSTPPEETPCASMPSSSPDFIFQEMSNTYMNYTTGVLKPNNDANKVTKKGGRPAGMSAKGVSSKKQSDPVKTEVSSEVKAEQSDED
ncbi:hypothetical protein TSTA_088920 [Talaromyces stipitatus ATCC 10500]|uniref:Uncharacterized protein n=1 Tax=Talaromyces stipitatus (strain ATCC 10500 / CBS 375.48 / QM 6759 / NRRL 1006) TaxID=441959 RepID=B8LZA3_TALSN|nr:uncharacterized protein TSTA_088920 [Talaromyces stipitatus ATCC 10500]EED21656.1 hypothetical protein TSTA_088920 [Talaromyces stipitatus ATCC 10500]